MSGALLGSDLGIAGADALDTTTTAYGFAKDVRLSLLLSLIAGFQILVSFGILWYTVMQLGAGSETDALYAGVTLPIVIAVVLIESLTHVLTPLLSAKSEQERRRYAWPLFLGIGFLFSGISLALFFAAPLLVPLIVPGFSDATKQLTVALTKIQLVGLVGVACYAVLAAFYQARNRFVWAALSVLSCSLAGGLLLVWKLPQIGVTLAAWVQVLIFTGPAVLLFPGLGRFDQARWDLDLYRELWHRVRPLALGAAYYKTGLVVDRSKHALPHCL